ncbi:MAG: HEAT repeat domain-containing protein, partial [Rivularia sp. (in: cyanobacteria)]
NALNQFDRYKAEDLKVVLKQPEDVAKKVGNILKDKSVDSEVRVSAARALGNLGDAAKPYVKDILDLIKDKSVEPYLRASAAGALGNMGDAKKPYLQDILDLIEDKSLDLNIRIAAVSTLKDMGDIAKPYIKEIIDIIKDESVNSDARTTAAFALGDMGDAAKPYIKEIFDLIKDESVDSQVRYGAASALSQMGDAAKPYLKEIFDLIKDESVDKQVRSSAAEGLGNLGDAAKPFVKDIADIFKDKSVEPYFRSSAASALSQMGDAAKPYLKDILDFVKDKSVESYARISAAQALGNLGETAKPYFKEILDLIKDKSVDLDIRSSAAQALENIQQLKLEEIAIILDNVYYAGQSSTNSPRGGFDYWRFSTYLLSGGSEEVKTLLKWTGYPKKRPDKLTHDEAVKTLNTFANTWQHAQGLIRLRNDLAKQIAVVARKRSWKPQDIKLLEQHYRNLKQARYNEADTLQSVIINLKGWQWFSKFRKIILIHAAFWLLLIFAYPKSPQIQAIFFWNPWVRRIFGMGYVGFLLAWIPFLRHKLFQPFQPSLLADAGLNNFDERIYFPESGITQTQISVETRYISSLPKITAISQVIPNIQGQIVLEGDSGLGKSMFLRCLVKTSKRIIVYLPARKCEKGVIEAIQIKLHGQAQDAQFLKNLIYSGAIDICIDGLNEVTADTRAQIRQFVESYFRGNIIMTTQPLEWEPPSTAKTYYLQPLEKSQIQQFLYSREPHLPHDAKIKGSDYEKNCDRYLDESLNTPQTPEELTAVKRILSNPMDLTLVALMLSQGEHPNVFHLQQQQYNLMAEEYQRFWQQDFPLKQFSEAVYQMRLNDESALPDDDFYNELLCMEDEKYKMVISRQWEDCDGEGCKEWYFRHDKIMDYFIVQTFIGDGDEAESRLIDNIGDPRFRGVYFLLATLLPLNQAKDLREKLIDYAADTKDHTVSDTFVQLLRTR